MKATYDYHRSERLASLGRFDFDALVRACLGGLRARVPDRKRTAHIDWAAEQPDFEDTMPAARASFTPTP